MSDEPQPIAPVAIVTGASRGIGRAIALEFARTGTRLVLVARSEPDLAAVAAASGVPCLVQALDLRDPLAPAAIVATTLEQFGRIDVVVNNAGATQRGDFLNLTDDEWAEGFGLKFMASVRLCRAAWPYLRETQGSIVNIAGIGGRTGSADFTIGGTVNAALLNLTKALADRGVLEGIRVNAVNPGTITTERLQTRIWNLAREQGLQPAAAAQRLARDLGIARFGEPEEVAQLVAFIVSPCASYLQGSIIDLDGGHTRTL